MSVIEETYGILIHEKYVICSIHGKRGRKQSFPSWFLSERISYVLFRRREITACFIKIVNPIFPLEKVFGRTTEIDN
jgi:hypothetical protein